MIGDLSLGELCILLRCGQSLPGTYFFDAPSKSVFVPTHRQIPWPVEFILKAFHPKHIFASPRRPSLSTIHRTLTNWGHRLQWAHFFKGQPREFTELITAPKDVAPCPHIASESLERYITVVKDGVTSRCMTLGSRWRSRAVPTLAVVTLGLQLLVQSRRVPILTEKDGGFASTPVRQLSTACTEILSGSEYRRINSFEFYPMRIGETFEHHCQAVGAAIDNRAIVSPLLSAAMRYGLDGLIANLTLTVKSHKPPGRCSLRAVHSVTQHPLRPAMMWIASQVRRSLSSCEHLILDSADLRRKLASVPPLVEPKFLKIDVKEFFMNGEHSDLALSCRSIVPVPVGSVVENMIRFILSEQYVTTPAWGSGVAQARREAIAGTRPLYRVVRGSGMGLAASQEISDANLFVQVEQSFAAVPSVQRAHSVAFFGRFADDILVIFDGAALETRVAFFNGLRSRSKSYQLIAESISSAGAQMLDMVVTTDERGMLITIPFTKPSSQRTWLSDVSCHPLAIHVHWPLGYIQRLRSVSTRNVDARSAILAFLKELDAQCPNHVALAEAFNHLHASRSQRSAPCAGKSSWLVLPFNAHWQAAAPGNRASPDY